MGTAYLSASHMNRGNDDLIRGDAVHQQTSRRDVCNGIHGTHLVEVDLRYRNSVRMTLRLSDQTIDCHNILFHLLWKIQMVAHNVPDVMETAVVMMVCVIMCMLMSMVVIMCMAFVHMLMIVVVVMLLMAVVMNMARTFLGTIKIVLILMVVTGLVSFFNAVMVVMVVEHLLRLFLSMHLHAHMGSANTALAHRLLHKLHTRDSQTV